MFGQISMDINSRQISESHLLMFTKVGVRKNAYSKKNLMRINVSGRLQ